MLQTKFKKGDKVSCVRRDYTFDGVVLGVLEKISGDVRYAVEDFTTGIIHIYETLDIEFTSIAKPDKRTPLFDEV